MLQVSNQWSLRIAITTRTEEACSSNFIDNLVDPIATLNAEWDTGEQVFNTLDALIKSSYTHDCKFASTSTSIADVWYDSYDVQLSSVVVDWATLEQGNLVIDGLPWSLTPASPDPLNITYSINLGENGIKNPTVALMLTPGIPTTISINETAQNIQRTASTISNIIGISNYFECSSGLPKYNVPTLSDDSPLPTWITYETTTQKITISAGSTNSAIVKVTGKCSINSLSQTFTVDITNTDPFIDTAEVMGSLTIDAGELISYTKDLSLIFSDSDPNQSLTYTFVTTPPFITTATIDPVTDVLTIGGNATLAQTGSPYELKVSADDAYGGVVYDILTITITTPVGAAPKIKAAAANKTTNAKNTDIIYDISSLFETDDNFDITYQIPKLTDGSDLPAWISFDSTSNKLNITTTTLGSVEVNVTAVGALGQTTSQTFYVDITNVPPTVVPNTEMEIIWKQALSGFAYTKNISSIFTDSDSGQILAYSVTLKPNFVDAIIDASNILTVNGTGQLLDINNLPHYVTVQADDGFGGTVTDSLPIIITTGPWEYPIINETAENQIVTIFGPDREYMIGNLFQTADTFPITYEDPTLSNYSPLPLWITYDQATTKLTIDSAAFKNVTTIRIVAVGYKGQQSSLQLNVSVINNAPTITAGNEIGSFTTEANKMFTYTKDLLEVFTESDLNQVLVFTVVQNTKAIPTTIVANQLSITWKSAFSEAGSSFTIKISANDSFGGIKNDTLTIIIIDAPGSAPNINETATSQNTTVLGNNKVYHIGYLFETSDSWSITLNTPTLSDGSALPPSWITYDSASNNITIKSGSLKSATIKVIATSQYGYNSSQTFVASVINNAPTVDSSNMLGSVTGEDNVTFTYTKDLSLVFLEPDLNQVLSYSVLSKPSFATATIDPTTFVVTVTWNASDSELGNHNLVVKADDSYGGTVNDTLIITITENTPPTLISSGYSFYAKEDTNEEQIITVFDDAEGDTLSYSMTFADNSALDLSWITFTSSNSSINSTVAYGSDPIILTLTASDGKNAPVSTNITMNIRKKPRDNPAYIDRNRKFIALLPTVTNISRNIITDVSPITSYWLTYANGTAKPSWIDMSDPANTGSQVFRFNGTYPYSYSASSSINFTIWAENSYGLQGGADISLQISRK